MKNLFYILFSCLAFGNANSQTPFNTMDSININKINASVLVHGDMWWDPTLEVASCKFPNGDSKSINFAGSLWLSAYDASNNLHVAAQTYRQNGNDYWPGPLDGADTLTYATSHDWAKIWKVNRTDINYFRGLSAPTTTTTPPAILTWPAKGNAYAQGNGGTPLTITTDMAPFIDLNGNGIYEPLLGEYPDIPGDQALWWVFSDNGPSHGQTLGKPLGVEVHAMAYAYNRGTLIDNVVYYQYSFVNKSTNNYHNFRAAWWDDMNSGEGYDYYIGFDSLWRLGIGYNGSHDDGGSLGHPANTYGIYAPVIGMTMIVLPGDGGGSYVPVGSFDYYLNDMFSMGNPTVDTEYDNYIRAKFRNGQHIRNDFSGKGIPSTGCGSGTDCNYIYTGDPSDTTQWSECNCGNAIRDKRFVLSSDDFTLSAGATERIVVALITTDTGAGGGGGTCPNVNFDPIKIVADTAWQIYFHPLMPVITGINNVSASNNLGIYPNPAHDELFIENKVSINGAEAITIFNTLGQIMRVPIYKSGPKNEVDVSKLATGLYYIQYKNGDGVKSVKFLKE